MFATSFQMLFPDVMGWEIPIQIHTVADAVPKQRTVGSHDCGRGEYRLTMEKILSPNGFQN